jgi:hypothetical protein
LDDGVDVEFDAEGPEGIDGAALAQEELVVLAERGRSIAAGNRRLFVKKGRRYGALACAVAAATKAELGCYV